MTELSTYRLREPEKERTAATNKAKQHQPAKKDAKSSQKKMLNNQGAGEGGDKHRPFAWQKRVASRAS